MFIKKISIKNYRGIRDKQEIPLSKFSSIIGKNDAGKSIILNAIATYLDPKEYPVTESDFNVNSDEIIISCNFYNDDLKEKLETKIKTKLKKNEGLDEFIADLLFENGIVFQKRVSGPKKGFDVEEILVRDFEEDDFSLLYMKSDEELIQITTKHSIVIPVSGTCRNSKLEKIKYIKQFCIESNKKIIERFIVDDYKISSLLPEVELFVSDYGLKADTTFKTNSVSELQEYFQNETSDATKKLKMVEKEIEDQMQIEAELIKEYMSDYATSLNKVEIKPSISWKDAIKSVDVNFQFDGDTKSIPMSHKGTGYRRLFMVARFRYLAEKNKGNNIIYLIEEPETFLHPSAQNDLLNAFIGLSDANQIIITTHSPVFTGATNIESVILCKKDNQSIYECVDNKNKKEFIFSIINELGIKPSYNLMDNHTKIVFVESHNDAKFYDIISKKIIGKNFLGNKKILVLPFGGGEDIESFINIDYFDQSNRDLYLIIDSDKHTNNEEKQKSRAEAFIKKPKSYAYVLKKSCIENYYHPRAFERTNGIDKEFFPFFNDDENAVLKIKEVLKLNSIAKNIKPKNNLNVFEHMTPREWNEVLEVDLIRFLENILN